MAKLIARLGDTGSHGGTIVTAASNTFCEGPPVARQGDTYACPIHGPNAIVVGDPTHEVEGANCAFHGSVTECGATIIAGSKDSYTKGS